MADLWIKQKAKPKNRFYVLATLSIVYALLLSNLRFEDLWLGDQYAMISLPVSYTLLLMSLFGTNEKAQNSLLALAAISLAYTAVPIYPDFYSRGSMFEFFGTDAWSITVLQVLGLVIFISTLVLSRRGFRVLRESLSQFSASLTQYGSKLIGFILLLLLTLLFTGIVYEISNSFADADQIELEYARFFYDQFQLILFSILSFLVALFGSALLSPMLVKLVMGSKEWWQITTDFSITQYLTRRIAAVVFKITFYVSAAVLVLGLPVAFYTGLDLENSITFIGHLGAIVVYPIALLLSLVAWILLVVIVRLVYEITNAVIHIAENTTQMR